MTTKPLADPETVRSERLRAREAQPKQSGSIWLPPGARPKNHRNAPKRGQMNKSEAMHAAYLDRLKAIGQVHEWRHGSLSLRLADRTWYRPDFLVATVSAIEIHEVKGHWEDDARAKFKIAAELYPMFVFRVYRREGATLRLVETRNA